MGILFNLTKSQCKTIKTEMFTLFLYPEVFSIIKSELSCLFLPFCQPFPVNSSCRHFKDIGVNNKVRMVHVTSKRDVYICRMPILGMENNDHIRTLSEEINFSKCTIGGHTNSLGKSIWSYTKYHME